MKNTVICIDEARLQVPKRLLCKGAGSIYSIQSSIPDLLFCTKGGLFSLIKNTRCFSGPCHHQEQFPWVDTSLGQCSTISSILAPTYFMSFSFQIGCKTDTVKALITMIKAGNRSVNWKSSSWFESKNLSRTSLRYINTHARAHTHTHVCMYFLNTLL